MIKIKRTKEQEIFSDATIFADPHEALKALEEQAPEVLYRWITDRDFPPCATGPWHYRTDTGDEHGKVVESAELPEKDYTRELLFKFKRLSWEGFYHEVAHVASHIDETEIFVMGRGRYKSDNWLYKNLIAWAKIRK